MTDYAIALCHTSTIALYRWVGLPTSEDARVGHRQRNPLKHSGMGNALTFHERTS